MQNDLEREAKKHIAKSEQTIDYLMSKVDDESIPERKREFMRKDLEATAFILEYAKEALEARGIKV